MSNINQLLSKIIQVQTQTINKINGLNINYQLPPTVVQVDQTGKIPVEYLNNYTAFQVWPRASSIKAGTLIEETTLINASSIKQYFNSLSEDEKANPKNLKIDYNMDAAMTHRVVIRSAQQSNDIDVVIDWGDGSISKCATDYNGNISGSAGDYRYDMSHTYATENIYTVKIYGNDYFGLIHKLNNENKIQENLICSILTNNLPVASHLFNFSSFCYGAMGLLYVDVYYNTFNIQAINTSNMFNYCKNLKRAYGFVSDNNISACENMFGDCYALQYTSFRLPSTSSIKRYYRCFYRNWALKNTIESLLPANGFISDSVIDIQELFYDCRVITSKLTPAELGKLLWNNHNIKFKNLTKIFGIALDNQGNQVVDNPTVYNNIPVSWGGAASDENIEKSVQQKLDLTNQNLSLLQQRILQLESKLTQ